MQQVLTVQSSNNRYLSQCPVTEFMKMEALLSTTKNGRNIQGMIAGNGRNESISIRGLLNI